MISLRKDAARKNAPPRSAAFWCLLLALSTAARSQSVIPGSGFSGGANPLTQSASPASTPQAAAAPIGGTATLDLITLKGTSPATPLRFGNVVPGSERVELDGTPLKSGEDYGMDNSAGVVYLMRPARAGQMLSVSYRYDPKAAPSTVGDPFQGIAGFQYGITPGLNMSLGLGVAERAPDGTVLTANNLGWSNNFAMGSGKVSGLFIVGDRDKQSNIGGMQMASDAKPGDASKEGGQTQFLVQNFRNSLLGGTVNFDYQDISKNFSGFSQAKSAGYDDATISRLSAEKGLQRVGYSLDSVKVGGLNVSNGYHSVKDGSNAIDWQSMAVSQGGMKLGWTSRSVDHSFTRFNDLSETDKLQLKNEIGMSRQDLAGSFDQKTEKISFDSFYIKDDATGNTIDKRSVEFDAASSKISYGDQQVDSKFSRFGSLLQPEQASYGREAGMSRQWLALDSAVMGKGTSLSFHQDDLNSSTAAFHDDTVAYTSKVWKIQRVDLSADAKFANFSAMQDAETDGHVKQIAAMYGPGIATGAGDRPTFGAGAGIGRSYTSVESQPFKNWDVTFSQLGLKGTTGGVELDNYGLKTKTMQITVKRENYGKSFAQASQLMGFEQQRIGSIVGLDRTDVVGTMSLGGKRTLNFGRLTSNDPVGDVSRSNGEYTDAKVDLQVASRKVSSGFQTDGNLVDSESAMLNTLRGYNEQDAHVKWQILPNMKLDSSGSQTRSLTNAQLGEYDSTKFDWSPSKSTQLEYLRQGAKNTDPFNTLATSLTQKADLTQNFGKLGNIELYDLVQKYDVPGDTTPDSHTQYASYAAKLSANTTVKTEQTYTEYNNGGHEDINANTVSQQLTKRAGVSVTQSQITSDGETQQDETRRNYGFWYDVGKGLRISYGYNRDMNGQNGTLNSTFAVGKNADQLQPGQVANAQQGQAAGVNVGGGYGVNSWDATKTTAGRKQSFSNVALDSAKPMTFGPFKEVKFKFGMDTASDYAAWLRDTQSGSLSGKLGSNQLGVDYKSQMQLNGDEGVDRSFHLVTDQNPKKLFNASVSYKLRTLPGDQTFAIRDFNVTARPTRTLSLSNQIQTNPEVVRTDLILGTLPQAARSNKWKLDYATDPRLTLGTSWEELRNDTSSSVARTGGLNAKLFANSPSPVTLFYGLQQSDSPTTARRTFQRYSFQFDQRVGPTQSLSMFIGNLSYDNTVDPGKLHNNWTIQTNYQIRFW